VSAPISSGPTSGYFSDGVHVLPLRIYYEDTDAAGIVYYANWLRFLERGRTELLRVLGQEHSALREARGVSWVVRRCVIDYLKPARLDETIEVVTRCGELRGASLDMIQEFKMYTTGLPAEFGHSSGGQLSGVMKSGTNQFHGSAEDRYLNGKLVDQEDLDFSLLKIQNVSMSSWSKNISSTVKL
jgi:acyl-CoA thioester hydrolase